VTPGTYRFKVQILLVGEDSFTKGHMVKVTTRLGQPYSAQLPAGSYRLMAQVGSIRLWDSQVTVLPGLDTTFDLTPNQSLVSPSEFPVPPAG
jgi:hypothetical protein